MAQDDETGLKKGVYPSPNQSASASTLEGSHEIMGDPVDNGIVGAEIANLARQMTTESQYPSGSLFPIPNDGPLNPDSPEFDARRWARAFYASRISLSKGCSPRTAGVSFRDLDVYGFGSKTDFQKSVGNVWLEISSIGGKISGRKDQRIDILQGFEGLVESGEMLAVLGPPGSGCTTFLKTVARETSGFHLGKESKVNYQGIDPSDMDKAFSGEAIYTAEVDDHFPHLTAGDALYFAAMARCPRSIPEGTTRSDYARHLRDVTMAMFGISHTKNTRVGNDFVRGVSGGERKRVTIAEAALSFAPIQCWDNSTRGLDSANAVEFCKTLRTQSDILGSTAFVAIYQAPEAAIRLFDKVIVLYEGRQIYFGKTSEAQQYFENLGFMCRQQQTTADFLTSMTSHQERLVRPGWEGKTPRSPDEFAAAWKSSQLRAQLLRGVDAYEKKHPFQGEDYEKFVQSRQIDASKAQRLNSPFMLSFMRQMRITLWRSWVMLKNDPSITLTMLASNLFEALIISSIFYNLPPDTSSFLKRGILLFFIVIINAFSSILEIFSLYIKRRVVEKHARYAFYHPSAEALSSMVVELPYKVVNCILMNTCLYFMSNLRREPGPFFYFLLITFWMTLSMSMMFRLIGSLTKSVAQALAPASIILLAVALYAGFAVPPPYMQDWFGWFRWINPIYYALEALVVNEFHGRNFACTSFVPDGPTYGNISASERVCSVVGSVAGQNDVSGSLYILESYGFKFSHRWRNFGVMIAFTILFMLLHLVASEYVAAARSKGEVLVFRRQANALKKNPDDTESGHSMTVLGEDNEGGASVPGMQKQTAVFHWKDVCYDITVKGEHRRILDHVDGWINPGTLTALMGVSGAGKTTLLDVLASRVTMGVISGDILVDGNPRDDSFQRKTGYVQQQDLHLATATVREALNFSALLRQPAKYSKQEKLDYVDVVIELLGMKEYSEAVIGVPGEGLNVEQRKRLTIGVELAARPQLLLFLDEPTSGLDSQTSWSICNLMTKLTEHGQAVLCTIHQPSAVLFERFDRLLLLAKGGKTVYFGEIGNKSSVLVDYFVRNGADAIGPDENPAEYMLQVIGAAPGAQTKIDWPAVWRESPEYSNVQNELAQLCGQDRPREQNSSASDPHDLDEFAAPASVQFVEVTKRVFQQYWRTPSYIYSKALLSFGAALFIGLSFLNAENTQRGLQNQMFGVFIFLTLFPQVVEQILPNFVQQRTMYEARERPSKAYSWVAFLGANIIVEIVWNSFMSIFCFICWYYPIGLYRNAEYTNTTHARGAAMFFNVWAFFMFASTFADMMIVAFEDAEMAGGVINLLVVMMFAFNGVLAGPNDLPGFWIFMYRVNPFTYVVEAFLGTSLANAPVHCAANEVLTFLPPSETTCTDYMKDFIAQAGGYLMPSDNDECRFCPMNDTNVFLKGINVEYDNRWRNFGFLIAYCIFNVAVAVALYWLVRVPKKSKSKAKTA